MAEKNQFKTGTDSLIKIKLTISGEVLSNLTQLATVFYYVRTNGKCDKFAFFAKDIAEAEIAQEAIDEDRDLRELTINGSDIECQLIQADTDDIEMEKCEEADVFVEVAYLDSNGDKQKYVIKVVDPADPTKFIECDPKVGTLVKSATEGWL